MIILKMPVQQVSGDMSEAYLSEIIEDGIGHSIRWRQDFELRIASPIEFENDEKAIQFLEFNNVTLNDKPKYVSSGSKIFLIEGKQIYFYCEIEEV